MDVWHLALYGFASFLALRTLVALMTEHRTRVQNQLLLEDQQSRRRTKKPASAGKL